MFTTVNFGTYFLLHLFEASLIFECFALEISAPSGMIPSRCIPASVRDNVVLFEWNGDMEDNSSMTQIFIGSGGLSGVNLCRPIDSKLCRRTDGTSEPLQDGLCPLSGFASLRLADGLHVIHVLVVSKDKRPTGGHETFLLQVITDLCSSPMIWLLSECKHSNFRWSMDKRACRLIWTT